jgi:hypothetical protein
MAKQIDSYASIVQAANVHASEGLPGGSAEAKEEYFNRLVRAAERTPL